MFMNSSGDIILLPFRVYSANYPDDRRAQVLFACNDLCEALEVAADIGEGAMVIKREEDGTETIVYIAPYKQDLSLAA